MANIIKGLTVEIGGDTTKLGKALEDVNKRSRDLSSELGDINRLLKLDPGNTDLLSQKQKVLADAIQNTGKKLDTLKEAERQVQEQFKRGEVSEEQVRALQREIIATEKKMDGYEKAVKETERALKGVSDETKEVTERSGKLGQALGNAAKVGLQAVTAAATAAVGGLIAAAESTREYRTEMGKLDTAFTTAGHSSEAATSTYKSLVGVLGETDQAVEAANHMAKLCENEKDLSDWTNIATGVYATFGASLPIEGLTEAANETAKVGQVTGPLADALNWAGVSEDAFNEKLAACTSEQERQALITDTLNGLYSEAADKYRETNAEVIRANEANEAWTSSMAAVGGAIEPIITDIKSMGASLLSDLVPGVQQLAESFRGLLNGDMGAAAGIGEALSGIITQILTKVTEMLPALAQAAMGLLTSLTTTLISMLPQLITTGVQIIMAIVQGLTTAIPQVVAAVVAMIPQLVNALVTGIPMLIQGAVQLLLAIVQAIPQIIPPLVAALPQIVMSIINALLTAIPQLIQGALQFLLAIVDAIPQLIAALVPEIPNIVTTVILGLLDCIPQLLDAAVELLLAIVEAIPKICVELIRALPQIWNTMYNYFKQLPSKLWAILKSLIANFVKWGTESRAKMKEGAKNILNAVVDTLKALPKRLITIGKDLVKGLWNGISNMVGWVKDKIKGFSSDVLDGIKSFFGIKSPSRVMRDQIGKQLARGLAVGIEKNTSIAMQAAENMSAQVLESAQKRLDEYKTYNEMALSDEVAYWDEVRKQCTEGTEARLQADKEYLNAKKSLDEQLKAAEEDYQAAIDSTKKKVEDRTTSILSSFKLFDLFGVDTNVQKGDLILGLESQVGALMAWQDEMAILEGKIGGTGLFKAIQEMGVDSLDQVWAINKMTEDELKYYVELYDKRENLARELATTELADENAKTIADAYQTYIDKCNELGVTVTSTTTTALTTVKDAVTTINSQMAQSASNALLQIKNVASGLQLLSSGIDGMSLFGVLDSTNKKTLTAATNSGLGAVIAKLDEMADKLGNTQIVLDTGTLVGETIGLVDNGLANRQALFYRGV